MSMRSWVPVCIPVCALSLSATAQAEPQASVGITVGGAGRGYGSALFYEPAFHAGIHGDVILARKSTRSVGFGPYAELLTHAFDELQFGGGGSLLIPTVDPFPLVLSVGPYGRVSGLTGLEPGIATGVFFGSRSYNFSTAYVMALGLFAQARVGLGSSHETSFVFGVQVDAAFAGLPIIYLIDAIRGGSPETDRVPK